MSNHYIENLIPWVNGALHVYLSECAEKGAILSKMATSTNNLISESYEGKRIIYSSKVLPEQGLKEKVENIFLKK